MLRLPRRPPVRQNTTAKRDGEIPARRKDSTTVSVGEMSSSEKLEGRKMTSEVFASSRARSSCCPRVSITTSSYASGDSIELRLLGEFRGRDRRLQVPRLPLRLPAEAGPLLDVEIGQQHFAARAGQRDRRRTRKGRFSDATFLRGEQELAGHGCLAFP